MKQKFIIHYKTNGKFPILINEFTCACVKMQNKVNKNETKYVLTAVNINGFEYEGVIVPANHYDAEKSMKLRFLSQYVINGIESWKRLDKNINKWTKKNYK